MSNAGRKFFGGAANALRKGINEFASSRNIKSAVKAAAQGGGEPVREGWWKPYVSGGVAGAAAGLISKNPVAALAAAKKGFDTHENVRTTYNVPWLGKKRGGKKKKMGKKRGGKKKKMGKKMGKKK